MGLKLCKADWYICTFIKVYIDGSSPVPLLGLVCMCCLALHMRAAVSAECLLLWRERCYLHPTNASYNKVHRPYFNAPNFFVVIIANLTNFTFRSSNIQLLKFGTLISHNSVLRIWPADQALALFAVHFFFIFSYNWTS